MVAAPFFGHSLHTAEQIQNGTVENTYSLLWYIMPMKHLFKEKNVNRPLNKSKIVHNFSVYDMRKSLKVFWTIQRCCYHKPTWFGALTWVWESCGEVQRRPHFHKFPTPEIVSATNVFNQTWEEEGVDHHTLIPCLMGLTLIKAYYPHLQESTTIGHYCYHI